MAARPGGCVHVQVMETGETGWANPDDPQPDGYLLHLDTGGTRILGRAERIRFLPPAWDLLPADAEEVDR